MSDTRKSESVREDGGEREEGRDEKTTQRGGGGFKRESDRETGI